MLRNNRGGKRTPGANTHLGRPRTTANGAKRTLWMQDADRALLAELGAGNLSAGLREVMRLVRPLLTEQEVRQES